MTLIALISDIHGNRTALRAVLDDVDRRGIERTYCLGDLVGYGPDPNGVIDLIRERDIPTITGNYDDGVGWERGGCGCFYATPEARRLGDLSYAFTVTEVTADRKAFLRELEHERRLTVDGVDIHLVHGSPRKINEYLLRDRDERTFLRLAEAETAAVLAFGHTHDPWAREYGGVLFVNVGSVGKPKDGDTRAMYSVLRVGPEEPVEVEVARVAYDVEAAAKEMVRVGLPAGLADALRSGR